jgi:hypothetical protein
VVAGDLLLVDSALDRDSATLAVTGVLPTVHPDVVDHWMDRAYDRRVEALVRPIPAPLLEAAGSPARGEELAL